MKDRYQRLSIYRITNVLHSLPPPHTIYKIFNTALLEDLEISKKAITTLLSSKLPLEALFYVYQIIRLLLRLKKIFCFMYKPISIYFSNYSPLHLADLVSWNEIMGC